MTRDRAGIDLERLLQAAVLAPSSHNTQPWIFQARPQFVRLLADRTRALPANDPDDRELTISCGCALFNLRVAAAAAGIAPVVTLLPDSNQPDVLAEVELTLDRGESDEFRRLSEAIPRRRTCRKRFEDRAVPPDILGELRNAAQAEGAELHVADTERDRDSIVALVAEGDAIQWSNPSWRRELAQWMHPRRQGDGLTVPGLVAPIAQAVVRTFDMGHGMAARDRQLAEGSPVLAVLTTAGDGPQDWLIAGQALERLLLSATAGGLQASYLNQPIQIASLRPELQKLIPGMPFPQVLLRLGYPPEDIGATPRRELHSVREAG